MELPSVDLRDARKNLDKHRVPTNFNLCAAMQEIPSDGHEGSRKAAKATSPREPDCT